MNRISRRSLTSTSAGIALVAMFPRLGDAATPKSAVCQPCSGNGNCLSKSCVNGLCAPYDNVCGGTKRPLYTCKAGKKGNAVRPKCCNASGRNCARI